MLVIGITGNFGTGKTTVAGMFASLGAKVLDADKMAHDVIEPGGVCFRSVLKLFGKGVLKNAKIDRAKISFVVFRKPPKLKRLCAIIHPAVIKEIREAVKRFRGIGKAKAVVIDAPLLIEAGLHKDMDYVIVVKASKDLQIRRIERRMNIKKAQILNRLKSQMSMRAKIRLADIVIDNRGNLKETRNQVEEIWQRLLKRKKKTILKTKKKR